MGVKSLLIRPYAQLVHYNVQRWKAAPVSSQQAIFRQLLHHGAQTQFGKDHDLAAVKDHESFTRAVPVKDYEGQKVYFDRVKQGEANVLWPGKPMYLAKTSGTTSGTKYIPITKQSIGNHFYSAQTALMLFMVETGLYRIMDGRMIFLSGSPELENVNGIPTGRLSGIVNHQVPGYLKGNQLPSWHTNCMEDWEAKLDKIVDETMNKDMTLISGIPPWVQMYFDKLIERCGGKIKDIFPNFSVFVYGGVNYKPYKAQIEETIGRAIPSVETYPASEGFFAYQDSQTEPGLLLNVNSGIFFEFVPADEIFNENPTRLTLEQVQLNVNYALIINSNAGLWGYNIGDTVKFVSLQPYRIVVTGRVKHFISAFGEHVIGEEVEQALDQVARQQALRVVEFTVAPKVNVSEGRPHHEWYIELEVLPDSLDEMETELDRQMCELNSYYADLINGQVLDGLKIKPLERNAFVNYMRTKGKLGGQNKVPRLSNDRKIADELERYVMPQPV